MPEAASTFANFSLSGDPAKAKFLVLGPANPALNETTRSLNLEHVSSTQLVRSEISRHSALGRSAEAAFQRGQPAPDETTLAVLRRWFWARKPDAGFVLADFPATLLQAKVFDEWLDARGEALTACLVSSPAGVPASVLHHYRTLGLDLVPAGAFLN